MNEFGDVYYFSNNIIVWKLPNFSCFPQNEEQIYSKLFAFSPEINRNFHKNPAWNFDPPPGYVGLILFSDQPYQLPINGIKLGVLNSENVEIGTYSIGEFMFDDYSSYFRVRSLIEGSILGGIHLPVREDFVYIRLYAKLCKEIDIIRRRSPDDNRNSIQALLAEVKQKQFTENEQETTLKLPLCVVCIDEERDTTLIPCGHLATCSDCTEKLNQCPICRSYIQDIIKTYIN